MATPLHLRMEVIKNHVPGTAAQPATHTRTTQTASTRQQWHSKASLPFSKKKKRSTSARVIWNRKPLGVTSLRLWSKLLRKSQTIPKALTWKRAFSGLKAAFSFTMIGLVSVSSKYTLAKRIKRKVPLLVLNASSYSVEAPINGGVGVGQCWSYWTNFNTMQRGDTSWQKLHFYL